MPTSHNIYMYDHDHERGNRYAPKHDGICDAEPDC